MSFLLRIFRTLFGRNPFGQQIEDLIGTVTSSGVDQGQKEVAGDALAKMGAPAVEPLLSALTDSPTGDVQDLISNILVKIGGPALGPLRSLLDGLDDDDLSQVVQGILSKIQK